MDCNHTILGSVIRVEDFGYMHSSRKNSGLNTQVNDGHPLTRLAIVKIASMLFLTMWTESFRAVGAFGTASLGCLMKRVALRDAYVESVQHTKRAYTAFKTILCTAFILAQPVKALEWYQWTGAISKALIKHSLYQRAWNFAKRHPLTTAVAATAAVYMGYVCFSLARHYLQPFKPVSDLNHGQITAVGDVHSDSLPVSGLDHEQIIAIGDVHGDLDGLKENLIQAGLVDKIGNWIGGKRTLVQLGDIVDRGSKTEEAWTYLQELQKQARQAGGKVVRIIGNHELMWLKKDIRYRNPVSDTSSSIARVTKAIASDILNCSGAQECDAQAAYLAGNGKVLFIHAGLTQKLDQMLRKEISWFPGRVTADAVVQKINDILRQSVQKGSYEHPIFDAGAARGGGKSEVDGVFWADQSVLNLEATNSLFQVVGHNPPKPGNAPIRKAPQKPVIYADAGMLAHYGGNRCFIQMDQNGIFSQCKDGWSRWVKQHMGSTSEL